MRTNGLKALQRAVSDKETSRFPAKDDSRLSDGLLFPVLRPSFRIRRGQRVFTIGSCFARNIEDFLTDFDVPPTRFAVGKDEWNSRPNGLLNEYNAGTIAQRMVWAAEGRPTVPMAETLLGTEDDTVDLLLPRAPGVTRARATERRREIDAIYADLPGSDVITITLGLTECWQDNETGIFLNRIPPPPVLRNQDGRYSFVNLSYRECVSCLDRALEAVLSDDRRKVILTVSPVPLQRTFTGGDCVTANMRSKSVLRAAADFIYMKYAGRVDYFPSYEIVMSGGLAAFGVDNVHVYPAVVKRIVSHLFESYLEES